MFGVRWRVVVEGYVAGLGVEVEGGKDEVRDSDDGSGFGEEGEDGDVGVLVVVGLVVEDYAGFVGGLEGRHGVFSLASQSTGGDTGGSTM